MDQKTPFEQKISNTFKARKANPAFTNRLGATLNQKEYEMNTPKQTLSWKWAYAFVPVLLAAVIIFAVGPHKVLAQLQTWLGFVPGAGLVENASDLRVLAEPVTQTRDGVTVSFNKAFVSTDKARFNIDIKGLPVEAHFSKNLDKPICHAEEYILLPDGSQLMQYDNFASFPKDVMEATYVIPCFGNYAQGMAPENWEIPIKLIAAPKDMETYAFELPEPKVNVYREIVAQDPVAEANPVLDTKAKYPIIENIDVLLVVEKPDSWLIGYNSLTEHLDMYVPYDIPVVTDANGKALEINFIYPEAQEFTQSVQEVMRNKDAYPNPYYSTPQSFELPKGDYAYPLTITDVVSHVRYIDLPRGEELFSFDAGSNPQVGDEFVINKVLKLGDYEVKVVKAYVDDTIGLTWMFEVEGGNDVVGISFVLVDYPSNFGRGGGGLSQKQAPYILHSGKVFSELPKGILRVGLAQGIHVTLGTYTLRGTWTPQNAE